MKELTVSAGLIGGVRTYCMESFCILAVDSRNKVSFGGILWNTTLDIDDFPLLIIFSKFKSSRTNTVPSLTHQQQPRLSLRCKSRSRSWRSGHIFLLSIKPVLFIDTFKI